jgi:hypothetical protein
LIQQASAALDPLAQDRQSFACHAGHFRFREPFCLQRHGGQRRAQFVRGIRHKAALRFHRLADTGEQAIDRHKRAYLDRKVAVFDRMQFLLCALVDFLGQRRDGPEHLAHQVSDDQQQHRHENQKRHHRAQCSIAGNFIAEARLLSHSNAFAAAVVLTSTRNDSPPTSSVCNPSAKVVGAERASCIHACLED